MAAPAVVDTTANPPRSFYIIGAAALLWNLIGLGTFLYSVTMSAEALAAMPEAQRLMHESTPAWATAAYAIAVFGGTLGCIALLLRKAWAVPLFITSLIAVLIQFGYTIFLTPVLELMGASALILPVLIIAVAGYLYWYSRTARAKRWIR